MTCKDRESECVALAPVHDWLENLFVLRLRPRTTDVFRALFSYLAGESLVRKVFGESIKRVLQSAHA